MEPLCECCGVVRAVVYCESDSARLCLDCDVCVHGANFLSLRHLRSLLCDKCNSQAAIVHCMEDKISLCPGCDWNQNTCSVLGHRRQALNCYKGCPSFTELPSFFSFGLDDGSSSGGLDHGCGSLDTLPKSDSSNNKCLEQLDNNDGSFGLVGGKLKETEPCVKYEPWMEQSSSSTIPLNPNYMPYTRDQAIFLPQDSNLPKVLRSTRFYFLVSSICILVLTITLS